MAMSSTSRFAPVEILCAAALALCQSGCGATTPAAPATDRRDVAAAETATLRIDKMMCQSCALGIQELLSGTEGVREVAASAAKRRVVVRFDPSKTGTTRLIAALKTAGFDAEDVGS